MYRILSKFTNSKIKGHEEKSLCVNNLTADLQLKGLGAKENFMICPDWGLKRLSFLNGSKVSYEN